MGLEVSRLAFPFGDDLLGRNWLFPPHLLLNL